MALQTGGRPSGGEAILTDSLGVVGLGEVLPGGESSNEAEFAVVEAGAGGAKLLDLDFDCSRTGFSE